MLRYALDNLGWYEFEGMIQSLLKARLGLGVEAWGGSGDEGKDAYYDGDLAYPTTPKTAGTFLFQCKFIEGANAAGSNSSPGLVNAVNRECGRIQERLASRVWKRNPSHYALLTNARIDPSHRDKIASKISAVLPGTAIHIHDGNDICAWLDLSPDLVRSFPQILGLRALEELLRQWVNADIVARSQDALEQAANLSHVFVPTHAYNEALRVLNKHFFVVLEGPPEMGKTAIGRMIALTQVSRGWEALECRRPEDVLREHKADRRQVFVADDFFGRTEYEPSRVSRWQIGRAHV